MREIIFRGKRIDNGEWMYGDFVLNGCGIAYTDYLNEYGDVGEVYCKVIPETIGQYTGLTDKNGTKIFEGDIVKTDKFSEPNKQYIIKFDLQFGAFIGQDKYNMYFVTFDGDSDQFEIIGNIHDNPELLKERDNNE
ncbi:MAG: hypothetical protein II305_06125 [Clostridia bacterium]|nr:hypothetical protein [Clostridia bacterium]MBQ5716182.1 hypothetical protein [Clostridia bacterium]